VKENEIAEECRRSGGREDRKEKEKCRVNVYVILKKFSDSESRQGKMTAF